MKHKIILSLLVFSFLQPLFCNARKPRKKPAPQTTPAPVVLPTQLPAEDPVPVRKIGPSAVTYTFSGGRFGDNLVAYLHAKWISYKYKIPLKYKPFPFSDQLMMHELESLLDPSSKDYSYNVTPTKNDVLRFEQNNLTLYTIPYFPESKQEYERPNDYIYFEVDWNDEGFREEIKKMIQPRTPLAKLDLPKDRVTVAVHVRKRTAEFDGPVLFEQVNPTSWEGYSDRAAPFKFATDEYYQEQVARISAFLGHPPMYVYLFTDSPNPVALVEQYRQKINLPNIEFDCRRTTNNHHLNVLEDFFTLTQFDCLVRVDSNFSLTASKLATYKIIVTPKHYYFHPTKGYPVIHQVTFTVTK